MKRQTSGSYVLPCALTALLIMLSTPLQAVEGFWVNSSGGNWNDSPNWTNTVTAPNGVGDAAHITAPSPSTAYVDLQNDVTLGRLVVENDNYCFGRTISASNPVFIFDRGTDPAELTVVNESTNVSKQVKFYYPLRVARQLDVNLVGIKSIPTYITGGFQGDSAAVLNILYELTGGTTLVELRNNQSFLGTVNLRRNGAYGELLGLKFYDANAYFGGGAGSVRVYDEVLVGIANAITDAQAATFSWLGSGHVLKVAGSGTLKDLADPGAIVPVGGYLYINNTTSTPLERWKTGADMPLENTYARFIGYDGGSGQANEEHPGTLNLVGGGNTLALQNRSKTGSIIGLDFADFARGENATLVLNGSGKGAPVGSSETNRVTVASGLPSEVNGILPPYLICYDQTTTVNGMFARNGANGLAVFDAYHATNDFSQGGGAVVVQSEVVDLGGAAASCYALRSRESVNNGDLTILSGGLILGSAFNDYTANLFFGANGAGNAYVHMDGHTDSAKNLALKGSILCANFIKFGAQSVLFISGSNTISGRVEIQSGGLILRNRHAIGPDVDVVMGYKTLLRLNRDANDGEYDVGGLDGPHSASVYPYSATVEHMTLHPASGTTNVFNGSLSDATGQLLVTVAGTGRQVFNGASDYTGDTVVESGATLLLGDDGVLGATEVSVAGGATFGGTGSTAGALVLDDGAKLKLTPGAPLRVASLDAVTDASVTIDVSENASFSEGPVLTWSGAGPAAAPDFELVGAPSASRGAYEAVFDAEARQVAVALVFPPATTIIVR